MFFLKEIFKNQDTICKEQIKAKNEDIENWVAKYFELEKKVELAESKLKSILSKKRVKKIRLDENSVTEIQTSMELDLNLGASSDDVCELAETQSIPAYQLPKKNVTKKDDYDCLENVEVNYENFRNKR